jgi:hypothetical protein
MNQEGRNQREIKREKGKKIKGKGKVAHVVN